MLVVKKDLYSGNVIGEDFFIKKEHNVKKGDKLVCPYDGTPYSGSRLVTQIHTKDGWV